MKKPKIVKKPFYTDEFIDQVCNILNSATDPATAAESLGAHLDEWHKVMNEGRFDKRNENRPHYDRIRSKCAQIEVNLTNKWANGKDGGPAAESFLKARYSKFNKRARAEFEANVRAICSIIVDNSCSHCKSLLIGKIMQLDNVDDDALNIDEALALGDG